VISTCTASSGRKNKMGNVNLGCRPTEWSGQPGKMGKKRGRGGALKQGGGAGLSFRNYIKLHDAYECIQHKTKNYSVNVYCTHRRNSISLIFLILSGNIHGMMV
jgi:hypothetical protein